MRTSLLLGAAALLAAMAGFSAPAGAQTYGNQGVYQADPYCKQQKNNRTMTGAAVGAVTGAVIGNNTAARGRKSEGSILGGVVGAVAGGALGRATANCNGNTYQNQSGYGNSYPSGDQRYPARQTSYPNDDYGLAGGPNGNANNCRWGTVTTRDPDGREMRENIYMCRGRDGVWRQSSTY
jgi:hypothetical protein